ncbi:COG4223 family protein [Pseudoruegeria sp. SK021]|uniref:COG4223 family protein n=1 Tax=Pseudoruegeria sp. SK021 TaxID=1933035 RepID=UPI00111BE069|nr:hypothetical protein [Pseudoruegeria sp. SK021]
MSDPAFEPMTGGVDVVEDAVIIGEPSDTPIEDTDPAPWDRASDVSDPADVKAEEDSAATEAAPIAPDDTVDATPQDSTDESPQYPVAAPPAAAEKSGGGFVPALLGGLIAAGLGFGAAQLTGGFGNNQAEIDAAMAQQASQLATLDKRLDEIATTIAKPADTSSIEGQFSALTDQLKSQFGDMSTRFDTVAGTIAKLDNRLGDVGTQLTEVETRLGSVDDRLTAVEKRPLVESSEAAKAAFDAYERELEQLRASLDAQKSLNAEAAAALEETAKSAQDEMAEIEQRATSLQSEAEASARAAAVREAVTRLNASLEQGTSFTSALSVLGEGDTPIPDVLTQNAEAGVASMSALQASFPAAARTALDAAIREQAGTEDSVSRIGAFLRTQAGIRSLAPREGDDPDAILSRAEASLDKAELETTLTEIGQLPQSGQQALATWVSQAQTRLAATSAAKDLTQTLLAN